MSWYDTEDGECTFVLSIRCVQRGDAEIGPAVWARAAAEILAEPWVDDGSQLRGCAWAWNAHDDGYGYRRCDEVSGTIEE